jgi:hypothetical protein
METKKSLNHCLLPAVFRHIPTGHRGSFIKEYKPTGKPLTMQIKLLDNRIWFAPKCEFEQFIINEEK